MTQHVTIAQRTSAQVTSDEFGQSIWYDNIQRSALKSGAFKKLVLAGVRGCTSNPTIFEKAIGSSRDYDEALGRLVTEGRSVEEIYYDLVTNDIRDAADILRPTYDSSNCVDGYISCEVEPRFATDTSATVQEAKKLASLISRPNLMIKIPGTKEGLPAVTEVIGTGISVNVTLIFSVTQYRAVAEAYIAGLERAAAAACDLSRIASVASFFVSRIDASVDELIKSKIASGGDKAKLEALLGKAAIANAKQAYQAYKEIFQSERFRTLEKRGAKPQRVLWASTGTKSPSYPDTIYVDELIGPNTVNTVPPQTLDAFQDHGKPGPSLEANLEQANAVIAELDSEGIPLGPVCDKLLADGVSSFIKSMQSLMNGIAARRESLISESANEGRAAGTGGGRQSFALGRGTASVTAALQQLEASKAPARLWNKERALFTSDASHDDSVRSRLGWLTSAKLMGENSARLTSFAQKVHQLGFRKALLLGMGGSSLCPEVLALTFGTAPKALELRVLDSTDPGAVASAEQWATLDDTLFVVASKSGGTIEVASFAAHFWSLCEAKFGDKTGKRFIAITDPGTLLHKQASERGYLEIFENPADIGGRYSALSYFGLVPAALLGVDLNAFLSEAERMIQSCSAQVAVSENPGVSLGAFMGGLAQSGRDKLTLIASPEMASLGSWIEQLVAESTGKLGKGVVPVDSEPVASPDAYADDRAFVYIRFGGKEQRELDGKVELLASAGFPVCTIRIQDRYELGGEFFRWEAATAFAAAVLQINPFDEPDVSAAKKATAEFIKHFETEKRLPSEDWVSPNSSKLRELVQGAARGRDYVVFSAYIERTETRDHNFNALRGKVASKLGIATTLGYGPRFLHSTGQLHKGGPNTGVFILLRSDVTSDRQIPGQNYSFGVLRDAQALGDQKVLLERGRRVIKVNLGRDIEQGLADLSRTLGEL